MRIRIDDVVEIMSGENRRARGKVLKVMRDEAKILVEGVNRVYRHIRRSQKNPQGGRLSKEMPVDVSKVRLVCTHCGKPTRVGARFSKDGTKERFCKRCNAALGLLSPARAAHAAKV